MALAKPVIHAVVGIIKRADKILITQRPDDKPYSGFWEFPGGKIENHEASDHALKRELYEELGIEVVSAQRLFEHQHTYPDKIVNLDIWLITHMAGEPVGKENQSLQWITLADIRTVQLLEGNWTIVDKLRMLGN